MGSVYSVEPQDILQTKPDDATTPNYADASSHAFFYSGATPTCDLSCSESELGGPNSGDPQADHENSRAHCRAVNRLEVIAQMERLPDGARVGVRQAAAWLDHHEVTVRRMVYDGIIRTPPRRRKEHIKILMGELRRISGEREDDKPSKSIKKIVKKAGRK